MDARKTLLPAAKFMTFFEDRVVTAHVSLLLIASHCQHLSKVMHGLPAQTRFKAPAGPSRFHLAAAAPLASLAHADGRPLAWATAITLVFPLLEWPG